METQILFYNQYLYLKYTNIITNITIYITHHSYFLIINYVFYPLSKYFTLDFNTRFTKKSMYSNFMYHIRYV